MHTITFADVTKLTTIKDMAFYASGLSTINLTGATNLNNAINDAVFADTKLTNINFLPSHILKIGDAAFTGCSELTSIVFPAGLTDIGEWAFASCDNVSLTSVVIPSGVTLINEGVFIDCYNLEKVTFKGPISEIKDLAFQNTALNEMTFEANTNFDDVAGTPIIGTDAFDGVNVAGIINVRPGQTVNAQK